MEITNIVVQTARRAQARDTAQHVKADMLLWIIYDGPRMVHVGIAGCAMATSWDSLPARTCPSTPTEFMHVKAYYPFREVSFSIDTFHPCATTVAEDGAPCTGTESLPWWL